ncbi:MAG TPA: NAD-dependent epimerase/dehydratase family protein [Longimicrobiales bacterium]
MPPRIAIVTGATGFVGSHLVDALCARGEDVRALVRPSSDSRGLSAAGARPVIVDLTSRSAVAAALQGADVVYHLAAATRARDEAEYRRANVDTTVAVVAAAASLPRPPRVVVLGSLAAAGPASHGQPVGEEACAPLTAYGRTKLEAERVALSTSAASVVVLRAPAVYGPRDRDLFTFFRLASLGVMPTPTGPDRPVQLIHVQDLVRALIAAGDADTSGRVYNVADPSIRPWSEVVELIARAVGRRPVKVPVPRALLRVAALVSEKAARLSSRATIFNRDKVTELLAPGWLCTTERAARELGFRTSIPLERGIEETAAWYRAEGWLGAVR